jgi:hypothetical protein
MAASGLYLHADDDVRAELRRHEAWSSTRRAQRNKDERSPNRNAVFSRALPREAAGSSGQRMYRFQTHPWSEAYARGLCSRAYRARDERAPVFAPPGPGPSRLATWAGRPQAAARAQNYTATNGGLNQLKRLSGLSRDGAGTAGQYRRRQSRPFDVCRSCWSETTGQRARTYAPSGARQRNPASTSASNMP